MMMMMAMVVVVLMVVFGATLPPLHSHQHLQQFNRIDSSGGGDSLLFLSLSLSLSLNVSLIFNESNYISYIICVTYLLLNIIHS